MPLTKNHLMSTRRPFFDVLVAAVLFGTTGTARALGAKSANALGVGAARLVVGGIALVILARGSTRPARLPWRLLGLAGMLTAVYQLAFFAGLDRAGVAVGTVVTIGSGPPLAGALAMAAGQGRPSRRWMLATALAVAGVVRLASPGSGSVSLLGIALALVSGSGYAGYTVVAKELIGRGVPGRIVIAAAFGLGGALLFPALFFTGPGWLATPKGAVTALYLGLIPTAFAYVLFARGLAHLSAATVTTVVLAEPLVASLLGIFALGERLSGAKAVGCGLVLAGLVVIATDRSPQAEPVAAVA
jgi:drug/metabolite transporter, DME family